MIPSRGPRGVRAFQQQWSKLRQAKKTCFEKHPGICRQFFTPTVNRCAKSLWTLCEIAWGHPDTVMGDLFLYVEFQGIDYDEELVMLMSWVLKKPRRIVFMECGFTGEPGVAAPTFPLTPFLLHALATGIVQGAVFLVFPTPPLLPIVLVLFARKKKSYIYIYIYNRL